MANLLAIPWYWWMDWKDGARRLHNRSMINKRFPLVTIVTPSYNQKWFLPHTLQSVYQQDYPYIEHIVIDGGSTDGTVELLQTLPYPLQWISEPDQGQAAAINKGFARAKGEIWGWLNSDDLYAPGAIRSVVNLFLAHPNVMLIYGDALAIDAHNRSYGLRANVKPCDRHLLVQRGDHIVQPAVFWRAELWRTIGPLDESLHFALDYEYWMRAAQRYPLFYLPVCLAMERLHGQSKTATGHLTRIQEIYTVARRYGGLGIPYHFRAEAATLYIWQAIQEWRKGNWTGARHYLANGLHLRPPLLKFLAYLSGIMLFGLRSLARLRLWANRARSWRRPCWPNSTVAGSASVLCVHDDTNAVAESLLSKMGRLCRLRGQSVLPPNVFQRR